MSIAESPEALAAAYREGGAGDVPRENERQWERLAIWPRTLSGVVEPDLSTEVVGRRLPAPILVAASAGHRLWHPQGEVETAHGVRRSGLLMSLSQGSSLPPEAVAAVSGPYLQQLYLTEDRSLLDPFIDRVTALGAVGLVLTVDQLPIPTQHPFREQLRAHWSAPAWQAYDRTSAGAEPARSFTAADVARVGSATDLPVLVKGILHPDDAVQAVDAGAAGIVVSNHGGRQLAGSVTTAEVLAEVVAAVAGRVPVHVDSGIRTAEDVFRALCLGAAAVHVGRPVLRALADGGAGGVADWLGGLVQQLAGVFRLAGAQDLADCHPGRLRPRT